MLQSPPGQSTLEDKAFLWLLVLVSLAFGWILLPFYGAVFWGVVLAIVFAPLNRRLLVSFRQRRTLAALATLGVIVLMVILPLAVVTAGLVREGTTLYERMQTGEFSIGRYLETITGALPPSVLRVLDTFGIGDLAALREKVAAGAAQGTQLLATRALAFGQNTLDFVVAFFITLYLAFFLLRDGGGLARMIVDAIPLDPGTKRSLFGKFATVIRATVKGNIVVAAVQGALGGFAFWYLGVHGPLLFGVLMAFLSLLPAVGAALVWLPVAIYFLVTGAIAKGLGLIAFGVLVIGLVDNVLRPVLVGKDIKMPDYLVLISTLGGIAIFGLNGFVIGPVIAAMFIACWDIFASARERARSTPAGPRP
ncbi:AI-2E family transporter [Piscinibacter koreensis]|uniref:AI-2E family transporter n=1 Tax=Piscinibacter koreensis TaxID=2742824 RepID=A0A7Y6TXC5_9BURK|nr:AI-2E family transporter [Schlegelella koreensis]NUZ06906.1 AI-2E family transporter [Schlegelella koreensis]